MQVLRFDSQGNTAGPFDPPAALNNGALSSIVFLHGFPGHRSRQNRDLAKGMAEGMGENVDVLLYAGLGCAPGLFSFTRCFAEVESYLLNLEKALEGQKVILVGHSWGGFLALAMARRFADRVDQVLLLSPLLRFLPEADAVKWFESYRAENPDLDFGDSALLARDWREFYSRQDIPEIIRSLHLSTQVSIIQARQDEVTPAHLAESMLAVFAQPPRYELREDDHGFQSNRSDLVRRLVALARSR